jgi:hypothetical protein
MPTDRSKNLDWMAVIFYPLAVVLMEAFWISPWLNWLGIWPLFPEPRPVLSLASIAIVLLLSLAATRLILKKEWSLWAIRWSIIGLGAVTMLFVLAFEYTDGYAFLSGGWFGHIGQALGSTFSHPRTLVVAIPVMIYLWWRGIRLGQSTSIFKSVYRSFLLGLIAFIVLIVLWQITSASGQFPSAGPSMGWSVIAFFFFGLMAIAICHLYIMRSTMPKEEAALTSIKRWLPVMLAVIGGMVLVGFGVASIFSPDFFTTISNATGVVMRFFDKILDYIMIPLNYIFEAIFWLLRLIIGLLRTDTLQQPGDSGNISASPFPQVIPAEVPPLVTEIIKWTVLAIIIGLVLFFLIKAIARSRDRHAREEIEEIHESLFSWRGLRNDLKDLLKMMGQRFQRKETGAPGYRFNENEEGMMDIRDIYRHMQWEGNKSGVPRRRYETSGEYKNRLERRLPDGAEQLDDIERWYESVRYGDNKLAEKQHVATNTEWRTIRNLLWRLRGY